MKDEPTVSKPANITADSHISVALLGGIFLVLIGGVWGASRWATSVDLRLERIEATLLVQEPESWSYTDMRAWAHLLRLTNPSLEIPDTQRAK